MADKPYIVMTVECQHCKTKQKVHVCRPYWIRTDGRPDDSVHQVHNYSKVTVPDRIVGGPFPA